MYCKQKLFFFTNTRTNFNFKDMTKAYLGMLTLNELKLTLRRELTDILPKYVR